MYWLCITTHENWDIIRKQNIWGVETRYAVTIKRVCVGDRLIFYVKQEIKGSAKTPSMIVGIFEVISEPFYDETPIFSGGIYPWRVKLKPIKLGEVEFKLLISKLEFIKNKRKWSAHLRGKAMIEISEEDYNLIKAALE